MFKSQKIIHILPLFRWFWFLFLCKIDLSVQINGSPDGLNGIGTKSDASKGNYNLVKETKKQNWNQEEN